LNPRTYQIEDRSATIYLLLVTLLVMFEINLTGWYEEISLSERFKDFSGIGIFRVKLE
jgi:hypothetical protein